MSDLVKVRKYVSILEETVHDGGTPLAKPVAKAVVGGVIANAVANALSSFGVEPCVLPLSPSRVWELVQAARPA